MSKSKKKNTVFTNVMSTAEMQPDTTDVSTVEVTPNIISEEIDSADVSATPIQYDDVSNAKDELIRKTNEISELTDKLSEYIAEISQLKLKLAELQNENDKHLIKIAELSFENAKLQANVSNTNTQPGDKINTHPTKQSARSKTVYYPYPKQQTNMYTNNGYNDWN